MSGLLPREAIHSHVLLDVEQMRDVSCGDQGFFKSDPGHSAGVFAIELKCLAERDSKALQQGPT